MSEKIRLTALKNLFDIMHGNKMDLNKMVEFAPGNESVAFVGRSGEANGIVAFVERVDGIPPYKLDLSQSPWVDRHCLHLFNRGNSIQLKISMSYHQNGGCHLT